MSAAEAQQQQAPGRLDDLSDELLDMVISDCGGKSLAVCIPRVAKRWTAAAARVLASLRDLDARRTPMRPWPLQPKANRIDPSGEIFKTRAQLLADRAQLLAEPGGEAKAQREDEELRHKVSSRQSDFLPDAFKWSAYLLPEPLRLVRLSSGKLRKVTQADYETGIEQRFTSDREGDSLETLACNLLLMVSKTVHLERLSIDADLWQLAEDADPPEECYMVSHYVLDLSFLPTPIAAQLKELTVNGRMLNRTADYLASACPNLEKLAFDVYIQGMSGPGEHVGWTPGLDALRALKLGCPKLTTIPLLAIPGSPAFLLFLSGPMNGPMNGPTVDQVFALLREWTTLQKVLIHSGPVHQRVMDRTMDFSSESQAVVTRAGKDVQLGRGSFVGKLSVEFVTLNGDDVSTNEGQLLLDQPHVSVRMLNITL